jgi:PleD family two-component response regulator
MTNIDTETLKNIKVLYVEDELDIQQTTLEILESIFDVVIPASNGVEAFDLYTDHGDFDILVTDINMPKMDGIELIKKIRSIDNNLPITITTAHTEVDFLHESINLGVNGYTLKPVNLIKLIETISKAVESRVLRKELERLNTNLIQKLKEKTFELNSILDSQENLVAVSDGVNVHTINQKFLDFLGKKSLADLEDSMGKIESLREKIQNSALSDIIKDNITASFGITEFKFDDTKDVLLKRVDIALYDAKNSGRNKVIQA